MKNIAYKIGRLAVALPLLWGTVSCDDWFSLRPDTAMVAQDFWQDKKDVESALGACYRSMLEGGFAERLLVWGEVRADNLIPNSADQNTSDLMNLNIKASNGYTSWGDFYRTINHCNALIQNAPGVREKDPDFSEADLAAALAEAKAVRAFCYFTLVRTFRDVPYITEPYLDDTRDYRTPQTDGDEILRMLIEDLKTVEGGALAVFEENIPFTKTRVTQKVLWTLMADIYLWLNDYENCVAYCDKVLGTSSNPLALVKQNNFFNYVFNTGYSNETIWELPFDSNTPNDAVNNFYGGSTNSTPRVRTTSALFEGASGVFDGTDTDWRRIGYISRNNNGLFVYKYVAYRNVQVKSPVNASDYSIGDSRQRHWVLYRLPDVCLMKAEALAWQGGVENLEEAVRLVNETYSRANPAPLTLDNVTQDAVKDLVLLERQREFLYEGKRYFDLMRRLRRTGDVVEIRNSFLEKRFTAMSIQQSVYASKLSNIDAFYLPINENELKLNTLLKQNNFYKTSDDISKN